MTIRILAATTNAGKLRDFVVAAAANAEVSSSEDSAAVLAFPYGVAISPLPGLDAISAPEEDQETFEGNAKLKAIYYSQFAAGEIVLADDSGLEVDALGAAPGVRSARYAEDSGHPGRADLPVDVRNNECLMAALRDVPAVARGARYRCVLVAAKDGAILAKGEGSVEGRIMDVPRGSSGFGYDPYFVPRGMLETMAELEPEARLRLSHRGLALCDLLPKLKNAAKF